MYLSNDFEKLICPGKLPPSPIHTVKPLEPRVFPLSIDCMFTSIALSLIAELALVRLPYLNVSGAPAGSWNVFEFTTSKPMPYPSANSFNSEKSSTLSQGK